MTFEQKRDQLEGEIRSLEEDLALYTAVFSQYQKLGADDPGFAETQKKLRQKKAELKRLYEQVNSSWYRSWLFFRHMLPVLWLALISAVVFLLTPILIPSFEVDLFGKVFVAACATLILLAIIWLTKTPF